jgi:ankyrin repeat protein
VASVILNKGKTMQEKFLNTLSAIDKTVEDQSSMEQQILLPSYIQSICQDNPELYNTLQQCVRSQQDINAVDDKGFTPLIYAIQTGSAQLVNFVLGLNANPNPSAEAKIPPLSAAIKQKSKAVLETLLACERTDVNQLHSNTQISALCTAVEAGYEDLVNLLLEKGAQPINPCFPKFLPLLHSAIHNKHEKIAILLLKQFPNLIYSTDQEGKTPLHAAVYYQCPKLVDYLLTIPGSLNNTDYYLRTPLWIAACLGDDLTISKLIAHGADYSRGNIDSNGQSVPPIEIAAREGNVKVVSLLINYSHKLAILSKAQHYDTSGMLQS